MEGVIEFLIYTGTPFLMLFGTWVIGRTIERSHLRSLDQREAICQKIFVSNLKKIPPGCEAKEAWLTIGAVVVGTDYFKRFGARLKSIIGGRLRTMEGVLERGRREAIMRMVEKAKARGANMVLNVRLETCTISRGQGERGFMAAEVVAYGTAVRLKEAASAASQGSGA